MTPEQQRIAIAEVCLDAFLNQRGFVPFQRKDHTQLALGGGDSFGLWIYRNPAGNFWGCNYSTAEHLREGEIQSWSKHRNYPESLDAAITLIDFMADKGWAFESSRLPTQPTTYRVAFYGHDDQWFEASAPTLSAAICEAFLRALNLLTE